MTIQQIQAAINSKANDPRQLINMIADYLQANPGGSSSPGSSYLVYTALLSQSGTDAPVATVFNNTIGAIVWTRDGLGQYTATLNGAFTLNKTYLLSNMNWSDTNANVTLSALGDENELYVYTFTDLGSTSVELDGDGLFVEIRVYP